MSKNYKSLHGFDVSAINDAIVQEMPILLDCIHDMHAHLMTSQDAEFLFKDDHPELNLDCDQYADSQLAYLGYIEILRALESLLTQTVKRGHEPSEPPSLLPYQLNKDYAVFWFNQCLNPSADEQELARVKWVNDGGYDELLARLQSERKTLRGRIASIASKVKRIWHYAVRTIQA